MKTWAWVALTLVLLLGACEKTSHKEIQNPQMNNLLRLPERLEGESSALWSARLVSSAERLMSINGFMHASYFLEKALEADKDNFMASFYIELLKPLMMFEGFFKRIEAYESTLSTIDGQRAFYDFHILPEDSQFYLFMTKDSSKYPIESEADFQKFLLEVNQALEGFRQFVIKNKRRVVKIRIFSTLEGRMAIEHCSVTPVAHGTFQISPCPHQYLFEASLNIADFEALQQSAAGLIILNSFLANWALDGIGATIGEVNIERIHHSQNSESEEYRADYEFFKRIGQITGFGQLQHPRLLEETSKLMVDGAQATKWFLRHSDQLCRKGFASKDNRRGYLFEEGLCIDHLFHLTSGRRRAQGEHRTIATQELIGLIISNLSFGSLIELPLGGAVNRQINPQAFLFQPPENLQTLFPDFDRDRCITGFTDNTLGGIFPNEDVNEVIHLKARPCR